MNSNKQANHKKDDILDVMKQAMICMHLDQMTD